MTGRRLGGYQKGSALIEGALVMSAFLALTISIVDVAHFFHQQQALVERTRAAVRAASVKSLSAEEIGSMLVFGQAHPPEGRTHGFQGLQLEHVKVEILDRGTTEQRVVVQVRGLKSRIISPLLRSGSGNLRIRLSSPLESE